MSHNTADKDLSSSIDSLTLSKGRLRSFPATHERENFRDWQFYSRSSFVEAGVLDVVDNPVFGMPTNDKEVFKAVHGRKYLGSVDDTDELAEHVKSSVKAYNMIIQSLHPNQIDHIRHIHVGNAYAVMRVLESHYGQIKSQTSNLNLMSRLNDNKKLINESMTDYIARYERFIHDIQALDSSSNMSSLQRKFYLLRGLEHDPEWKTITTIVSVNDSDSKWTIDKLKQFLITQDDEKTARKMKHETDTLNNSNNKHALSSSSSTHHSFRGRGRGRSFPHRSHHNGDHHSSSSSSSSFRARGRGGRGRGNRGDRGGNNHHNDQYSSPKSCLTCGKTGHTSSQCWDNPDAGMQCNQCKRYGHRSANCLSKKRSYTTSSSPPSTQSSSQPDPTPSSSKKKVRAYVVISSSSSTPSSSSTAALHTSTLTHTTWILDSGATDHFISDDSHLFDTVAIHPPRNIITANGQSTCNKMGTVMIHPPQQESFKLTNVLFVPHFNVNLMSVRRIVKSGAQVVYNEHHANIMTDDEIETTFDSQGELWVLSSSHETPSSHSYAASSSIVNESSKPSSASSSSHTGTSLSSSTSSNEIPSVAVQLDLMHRRFGHVNFDRLIKMIMNESVVSTTLPSKGSIKSQKKLLKLLRSHPCVGCLTGKMSRAAKTGVIKYHVNKFMDMWVFDTMIMMIETIGGCKYITVIMDVHTKHVIIALHEKKSHIASYLIKLIKRYQTQFECILKFFHSDNGTEVCNDIMRDFFDHQGTSHTTSTVYTPEHNAIAERKIRTIVEMMKSIMNQCRAYPGLYGEAAKFVEFILDRVITVHHNAVTPYEARLNKKPNVSYIRVWGCDVYYYIEKNKRDNKLSEKSKAGIFVGYDEYNPTYYRVYDVDSLTIIRTTNVKFYEDRFDEMKRLRLKMNNIVQYNEDDFIIDRVYDEASRHSMTIDDFLPDAIFGVEGKVKLSELFGDMPPNHREHRISDHADDEGMNSRISDHADDNDEHRISDHADDEEMSSRISDHADDEDADRIGDHADDVDIDDSISDHADEIEEDEVEGDSPSTNHISNKAKKKSKKRKMNGHHSHESSNMNGHHSLIESSSSGHRSNDSTSSNGHRLIHESSSSNGRRSTQQSSSTRSSSRVTATPFIFDPSHYHARDLSNFLTSSSSRRPLRIDPSEYALIVLDEPLTYEQAINSSESNEWLHAIQGEFDAHEKNKTWSIVKMNHHMNIIGCRWVFKRKRDVNGAVIKYKARLVAKGFSQVKGIDFHDTFAPVLNARSLRILFVYSVIFNTRLDQLDVKTAFLNAPVQEDIFISIPDGMDDDATHVLKLNRALYGIKQAPREWFKEISHTLQSLGYSPCIKDTCLYSKKTKTNNMIVLGLFVDDMPIAYHECDSDEWNDDKRKLKTKYELSELGDVHHILGMKVNRSSSSSSSSSTSTSLTINQESYIKDKLESFEMHECNQETSPAIDVRKLEKQLNRKKKLSDDTMIEDNHNNNDKTKKKDSDSSRKLNDEEVKTYQMMVGSLIYASVSTRPDITHAVNRVAACMSAPTSLNMTMVKRIFRYLNGTRSLGLRYTNNHTLSSNEIVITGYCDADWGGDLTSRRSTTGYCTFINDNLISWRTKLQPTVALSSAEAEYMAIGDVAKEIMWMRMILTELNLDIASPTIIRVDNQSAIKMGENNSDHERTKHIDIKHHFIRELVKDGSIAFEWVPTEKQLADILTKALATPTYISLRDKLMNDHSSNDQ
jgi:hypothetical protein